MTVSTEAAFQSYDIVGIGVGPFNLGLASLLSTITKVRSRFFDAKPHFDWHAGLLIDGCTLQVPFFADLVTMVDPSHPLSYLKYLQEHERLYQFYFHEKFHISRIDYNRYCRWASEKLPSLSFAQHVTSVNRTATGFDVQTRNTLTGELETHKAKHVVVGIGSTPSWPQAGDDYRHDDNCFHSADYLYKKAELQGKKSIVIVGGGQSAAEIFLDLLKEQSLYGYELNWLSRSSGFLPMEYSKFGLEHFSPDYIEHFHRLPEERRESIRKEQGNLYKGISFQTIADIHDVLYLRGKALSHDVVLQSHSELIEMTRQADSFKLLFRHLNEGVTFEVETDAVVMATGYKYDFPSCLENIRNEICKETFGHAVVRRDYSIEMVGESFGRIFIQNGEMHSHGICAQDLGMGPYRSATIINSILGYEHYSLPIRNVFQSFGVSEKWEAKAC
jgi:lysine N6-hydroxylase